MSERKMSKMVATGMVAAALLAAVPEVTSAATLGVSNNNNMAFIRRSPTTNVRQWEVLRGGATLADDDEDEYDEYDEYDSEEEEEEEEVVVVKKSSKKASLAKSAVKASAKAKAKKTAASKKVVNSAMTKKTSTSILKMLHVPYIIRASLNPFMLIAMTKGYFASLFNLNYMKEDESQGLRSALEEKAKRAAAAGGGSKKGKRTMRPGQAKTLSDLPQLNT